MSDKVENQMSAERKAYAKMRTGFNALMLEVHPSIVNDLLGIFEEYVAAASSRAPEGAAEKYFHLPFCNGSRQHPPGTKGVTCSCILIGQNELRELRKAAHAHSEGVDGSKLKLAEAKLAEFGIFWEGNKYAYNGSDAALPAPPKESTR